MSQKKTTGKAARDAAKMKKKKQQQIAICAAAAVLVAAVLIGIFCFGGSGKVTHNVVMEVKDYGTIQLELYGKDAPITVENFVKLAESGFYDGLTFHRIMEGFMIQGGCPEGTGMGDAGYEIKGEFAANGVKNDLSHTRGVLSMARSSMGNDTASCQFFIMHQDYPGLDGQYAAFGRVTDGMDVVDAIAETAEPTDNNGTIPAEEQPVITSVRVEKA